jgi:hypothetical protein
MLADGGENRVDRAFEEVGQTDPRWALGQPCLKEALPLDQRQRE